MPHFAASADLSALAPSGTYALRPAALGRFGSWTKMDWFPFASVVKFSSTSPTAARLPNGTPFASADWNHQKSSSDFGSQPFAHSRSPATVFSLNAPCADVSQCRFSTSQS